jgi:O-antigen ligase
LETKEIIKFGVLLFLYFIVPPVLGFLLRGQRRLQYVAFFAMCFMTISGFLSAAEWGFTIGFVPDYRGHARGFHFYLSEVLALTLIIALALEPKSRFKLLPPGLWLYSLYCGLCLVSIFNAPSIAYVGMAALKAFKVVLIFIAAYNFLRSEKEVHFFLKTMCVTILWQFLVVVKMKYYDGRHQIMGTFEHQNALAMYVNLIAMGFLAAGASAKGRWANFYLFAFLASAVIVVFTLSRGGLAVFAIGTVVVIGLSLLDKFTKRRVAVVGVLAVCGFIGVAMTMDSLVERFMDRFTHDSKITRTMLQQASIKMFKDHPLGIGWNNYGVVINHPYRYGDHIDQYFREHGDKVDVKEAKGIEESLYYLLLAETGFQGLGGFLAVMLLFLWWNLRGAWRFRHQFLGAVSIGIAVGCGINYLQSFLERVLTQPRNLMLWMLLLALSARIETWRRQDVQQKARRKNSFEGQTPLSQPMSAVEAR